MKVLRQDASFSLPELTGRRIVAVLGVVDLDSPDDEPILVNLQLDDGSWHRFYLDTDVGFASWERHEKLYDADPDGDEIRHVDYAQAHRLSGEVIRSVLASPFRDGSPAVIIRFDSERFLRLAPGAQAIGNAVFSVGR